MAKRKHKRPAAAGVTLCQRAVTVQSLRDRTSRWVRLVWANHSLLLTFWHYLPYPASKRLEAAASKYLLGKRLTTFFRLRSVCCS